MASMHAMFEIAGFSGRAITTFSNVPTRKIVRLHAEVRRALQRVHDVRHPQEDRTLREPREGFPEVVVSPGRALYAELKFAQPAAQQIGQQPGR
jgi:hypothetical protein